jgi:hypothetical protein
MNHLVKLTPCACGAPASCRCCGCGTALCERVSCEASVHETAPDGSTHHLCMACADARFEGGDDGGLTPLQAALLELYLAWPRHRGGLSALGLAEGPLRGLPD